MRLTPRIRRLERQHFHRLSAEDQRSLLQGFIQAETMVRGQPLTEAAIAAERARLAQPIKQAKPEEIRAIAEEIETIITNDRP